jgi:AraC-like DNA-binding protein
MPLDRLTPVFQRFRAQASQFQAGPLCGSFQYDAGLNLAFLHVLRRGRLEVLHRHRLDGLPERLVIDEPTLLFYARPCTHDFVNPAHGGNDFVCATVAFDGAGQHPLTRAMPPLLVVPLAQLRSAQATLEMLFAEADAVRCGQSLLANRLWEVLLIQLMRWLLDRPAQHPLPVGLLNGLADPALAHALTAIHDRPADPWTVQALAKEAGMSRSAFAVAFKAAVGSTPADYLAQWRLSITQQRLAAGDALKQVAVDVGYGTPSALSRAFSMRIGLSPRAWLKQKQANAPEPG